ncbi:kinetochore Nnf1 [Chlorella sorokiniana]|uniref:Kinetochore Nnf1 n=1 Tax=Chlorella sorokiniana TaxID=3076 RepID=A0A2P6TV12_CHLSO|nr:kinetochore Nnf1 [Chlorella sorokiniana]|eukprot:PRW57900.1 kinetochore Nnf1 [Chlorella sorokiniana]
MPAEPKAAARRHGRRLRALGDAFHRTVKYALRPVDLEAFAQLFPTLRDGLVESLYEAFKQVVHQMRVFAEAEYEEAAEEHGLRDKLVALEELCEAQGVADGDSSAAAPDGGSTRQPGLGPTNAIRLSLLRAKQAEAEQLRRVLAEVQAANEQLAAQREERRRAAQDLLAKSQPLAAQLEPVHVSSKAWANRVVEPVG